MGSVRRTVDLPGPIAEVEALFYDPERRRSFVEGLTHVAKVDAPWPQAGGRMLWDAAAKGGRGRVLEQVLAHVAREGQTCHLEDARVRGTQEVSFVLQGDGQTVRVVVEQRWELKVSRGVPALHDLFVVRRSMAEALRLTLWRLRNERLSDLDDEREAAAP